MLSCLLYATGLMTCMELNVANSLRIVKFTELILNNLISLTLTLIARFSKSNNVQDLYLANLSQSEILVEKSTYQCYFSSCSRHTAAVRPFTINPLFCVSSRKLQILNFNFSLIKDLEGGSRNFDFILFLFWDISALGSKWSLIMLRICRGPLSRVR